MIILPNLYLSLLKKIFYILILTSIISAEDLAGDYRLSGAYVIKTHLTRTEVVITVSDAYGLGVTIPVGEIPKGIEITPWTWQLDSSNLAILGVNINLTLNEDGSGSIEEGSYCGTEKTITDENGNCVTVQQVLPVTDEFTYESSGYGMADLGIVHPGVNVLGMPSISSHVGEQLGLFGFSGTDIAGCNPYFENLPMTPSHPTLCDDLGNCLDFVTSDGNIVPGGSSLPGYTGGYFLKRGLNIDDLHSVFPGNIDPDLYLEWHSVDGASSGFGYGEDDALDEDGDGTWFDRQVGIPAITATYMNPACGFNRPIWGDVTAAFEAMGFGFCVDYVDAAASAYLMDAALATWSNFMTANAAQLALCLGLTDGDVEFCSVTFPQYLADDSDHDFNGTDGRLTMNFDIPCVGIIEAREVIAEFIEVGGSECGSGDISADGGLNILDVVALLNQVLVGGSVDVHGCLGDMNADDGLDILDITMLFKIVLGGDECNDPDSVDITISDSSQNDFILSIDSVCVKGLQISLLGNFTFEDFEDNDDEFVSYAISEGVTLVLIFNRAGECIPYEISMLSDTNSNESFEILDIIAAGCNSYIPITLVCDPNDKDECGVCFGSGIPEGECDCNGNVLDCVGVCGGDDISCLAIEEIIIPENFSIHSIYPNPFNPVTNITYGLPEHVNVQIIVYDLLGKQVVTLINELQTPGYHSVNWDADNLPSGVYLIRMDSGEFTQTQKVVLVK